VRKASKELRIFSEAFAQDGLIFFGPGGELRRGVRSCPGLAGGDGATDRSLSFRLKGVFSYDIRKIPEAMLLASGFFRPV